MKRSELKKIVKAAVPSVTFHDTDGCGTKSPRWRVECTLPLADLPALEAFAESIGRKVYGISVLCYPGYNTDGTHYEMAFRCINVEQTA